MKLDKNGKAVMKTEIRNLNHSQKGSVIRVDPIRKIRDSNDNTLAFVTIDRLVHH